MLAPGGRPAERNPRVHGLAERPRLRRVASGAQARREWERAVLDRPDLAVTQLPAWLDCMVGAGYHDATRLYESADGRRLVLPLARRGQLPGLGMSASWPMYWEGGLDNGGLLSADGPVTADDVTDVAQDLRRNPGLRTTVTPSVGDAAAWAAGVPDDVLRTVDTMFSVDLERGFAGWSASMSKTERYKARKAERHGVQVESDDTGRLLPVFERLYDTSVAAWAQESAMPSGLSSRLTHRRYPHATVQRIAETLGPLCRVWIAWKDGEPLSGLVVLSHGPAATYYKGATDKTRTGSLGVGTLLHRDVIERACAEGRQRYELSGSGVASLTQFKRSLGARELPLTSYRFERGPVTRAERALRSGLKAVLTTNR